MAAHTTDKVSQRPKTQNNMRPKRGDSEQQEAIPGELVIRLGKAQTLESQQDYPPLLKQLCYHHHPFPPESCTVLGRKEDCSTVGHIH